MLETLSVEFSPLLPAELLYGFLALSVGLGVFLIRRRAGGGILRMTALVAICLALLNPLVVEEKKRALKDVLLIMVDESPSQKAGDREERTEKALTELQTRLGSEKETLETRIVRFGSHEISEEEEGTRIMDDLRRALADIAPERLAAVVLLSDGQIHDLPLPGEEAAGDAEGNPGDTAADARGLLQQAGLSGPLHLLLTGAPGEYDRRLEITSAPGYGIVGSDITISLKVMQFGRAPGGSARPTGPEIVELVRDGEPVQRFQLTQGEEKDLTLPLRHGGESIFRFRIETRPGELTSANNEALVPVNAVRDRLRVLLISGEPHAGERSWRNLLKSDPSVDLVHFTILRPPEKLDYVPIDELSLIAFPIQELFEVKLEEFDLVIFDRYRRRGVLPNLYLENIVRYIRSGGALLLATGPDFPTGNSLFETALGEILPARPSGGMVELGFLPMLTAPGLRHPVTSGLPGANRSGADGASGEPPRWGRWFRQAEAEARSGEVLMTGAGANPLLVLDRVGEGRVAQILSDHMWLWDRGFEGGGPQAELMRRLAHWLMQEPDLEENDLKAENDRGRLKVTRRALEAADRPVTVIPPSGPAIALPLEDNGMGEETGYLDPDQPGLYRVEDGDKVALAAFGTLNPLEFRDLQASGERMAPLVEISGGGTHFLEDENGNFVLPDLRRPIPGRDMSGRDWIGLRKNGVAETTGVSERQLLPGLVLFFLCVGGFLMAWYREGRTRG